MRIGILFLIAFLTVSQATAQESRGLFDRLFGTDEAETDEEQGSLLERFLEDNLSGDGRQVSVRGFSGALSGLATLDSLTVSDSEGEWLTLTDVTLDWSRAALFRGRLEVVELSAAEILFPRLPVPSETSAPPTPEASGFSLPELPVAVAIDSISAERVAIGQPVFGAETEVSVSGNLRLEGGEGSANLALDKLDGSGAIALEASYANQSQVLALDLDVTEGPDGIIAGLLDLPGRPSVEFAVAGEAPITAYAADVRLATDGTERLTGRITTSTPQDSEPGTLQIVADLSGDIAPIFNDEYQEFFGTAVQLGARITTYPDGRTDVEDLDISAAAIRLAGEVRIGSDGLPDEIKITGDIAADDGPVLLPLPGPETRVGRVDLDVGFDAAENDRWTGNFLVSGLERAGFSAQSISLSGGGRITSSPARSVTATLGFEAASLDLGNPEATRALGEVVTGGADIRWQSGGPVRLASLTIDGESYGLEGNADITFGPNGPSIEGSTNVTAEDLAAFSGIAGRTLGGRIDFDTTFDVEPLAGFFDIAAKGDSENLIVSQPQADRILDGTARLDFEARRDRSGISATLTTLETPNASLTGQASLKSGGSVVSLSGSLQDASILLPEVVGPISLNLRADEDADRVWTWQVETSLQGASLNARGNAVNVFQTPVISGSGRVEAEDLAHFAALIGRPVAGALASDFSGEVVADLSRVSANLTGTATNLETGYPEADALLAGAVDFDIDAAKAGNIVTLGESSISGPWIALRASGALVPEVGKFDVSGRLTDASRLLQGAPSEAVEFAAKGQQDGRDWQIETNVSGAGLSLSADGVALDPLGQTAEFDGEIRANADDLSILSDLVGQPLAGRLSLNATGRATADLSRFDLTASATGGGLRVGQAQADRLLAGDLAARLDASRNGGSIDIGELFLSTGLATVNASGSLAADGSDIDLSARLSDISSFAPGFSGPATIEGTIGQAADAKYQIDLNVNGPGDAAVSASGSVAPDFQSVNLGIDGRVPLGILNEFIAPRAVSGMVGFQFRMDGPPARASLNGQASSTGARFIDPTLGFVLNQTTLTASVSGARAQLALTAQVENGGAISVQGPVSLTAPFDAGLEIALNDVVLKDARLYETSLAGNVALTGPLAGGARIAGDIRLGETTIRIPSSGLGGAGAVPEITHLKERPPVRETRRRAGLLQETTAGQTASGPGFPLDIRISAPNRLFIRGRGLESEFGGELRITGNTNDVIPIGGFNLVRGRLDILGQRLALEEATVTIQGSFLPVVRIRATTQTDEYAINVTVAGPVTNPEITFSSDPDLPQEEVLARLIFGRGLDTLSPFQAARLALAVRTLAGQGGEGIVGSIRQGAGLADLDVTVDEAGNAAVTAGAYLGENLYTDVTVGAGGETELNLNLDLSQSFTLKGSVTNEGDTAFGVYFERDY